MADNQQNEKPDQETESNIAVEETPESGSEEQAASEASTTKATTEPQDTSEESTPDVVAESEKPETAAGTSDVEDKKGEDDGPVAQADSYDAETADDADVQAPGESAEVNDDSAAQAVGESAEVNDDTAAQTVGESAAEDDDSAAQAVGESAAEDEDGDSTESEEDTDPVLAVSDALTHAPGMIGYTGEISGEVYRLEDLDSAAAEPEEGTVDLDDLRKLVEGTLTNVSEHEIVSGRVVSIGEKDVVIDIGFKSDGIVSRGEWDGDLEAGDEVEVYLERIEDYHGQLVLSKTKADTVRRWRRIEDAFNNEEVLEGTIVRRIKGGMIVELFDGMEAFLPGSQVDVRPVRDFDTYLDKRMEFKIVKLNPANENIVVSHKALIEKDLQAQRESILETMEPGQILEGVVKNITDFGVFIDLGGVDGLLHITDLSWGRVSHPSELVNLDDKLNIVVLDYDKERQRISLGLKQLQPHPWENIEEKYTEGETVEGKVVSITDYGAFVEIEKGIEGLVHISEMSWTEHIRHPSQMVNLGQLVNVRILNIDSEGKKISLGMKQLEPDPWDNIADRYPPGTVMRGKVRNITNFGVFVEIEPGIDGLVHISDLSWTKRIRHPSEMVKKGQELDVVVLNIDTSDRRISLGHKQVDTNPWNQFATVYAEGSSTSAKVVRVEDKGLVVELPLEVEAFMPEGDLPQGRTLESMTEGEELENLFVIRFDAAQKEIVVSAIAAQRAEERAERDAEKRARAQERAQEQREVSQFIEKEGASGPTTLGELSGLAELKAQMEQTEAKADKASKDKAKASKDEAKASKDEAKASKDEAKASEDEATTSKDEATTSKDEAKSEDSSAEAVAETAAETDAVATGEVEAEAETDTGATDEVATEEKKATKPKKAATAASKSKAKTKAKKEEASETDTGDAPEEDESEDGDTEK